MSRLTPLSALLLLSLTVSAQTPPAGEAQGTPPVQIGEETAPADAPAQDIGQSFATRNASFEPRPFSDLPGWHSDDHSEAVGGMRQSCAALGRKPVWTRICAEFSRVSGSDSAAVRAFFENNFYVYQVMSPGRDATGKLTGYFEPLLDGSRNRDQRFRYPVYGLPDDLLLLDSRSVGGGSAWLARDGNRLKVAGPGNAGAREYQIALDDANAGVRDKRYRVRINGRRVVPYWSRQEIERRAIQAPVLAWVDNANKLYSMQVQGSGKIRLREGGLVRLAYAEQNGHPFRPRITRGTDAAFALTQIKARGLIAGGSAGASLSRPDAKVSAPVNAEVARLIAALKSDRNGATSPPLSSAPAAAVPTPVPTTTASSNSSRPTAANSREVADIIKALKGQGPAPVPRPASSVNATSVSNGGDVGPSVGAGNSTSSMAGGVTGIPDPSFVFFRKIGDGPEGPIGALGVPLSAERSVAVDPRTTPLGAPVFISSIRPGGEGPMQKLMFAQDTGGAIRGSVRADFFWGFGDTAGRLALATNEVMRMWLMLPKQQTISAVAAKGMRLRGGTQSLPDCVIEDPDLCVED